MQILARKKCNRFHINNKQDFHHFNNKKQNPRFTKNKVDKVMGILKKVLSQLPRHFQKCLGN